MRTGVGELLLLKPLVVAASAAAIVAAIPLRAEIVEQVLVKVNGEIISKRNSRRGKRPNSAIALSRRR
jgi:hypothetical protein